MEENRLFSISIEELLQYKMGAGLGNKIIVSSQITEVANVLDFPLRIDAIAFCVCMKGNAKMMVNLSEVHITEFSYIFNLPENIVGFTNMSEDFEGFIVVISMDYLREISLDLKDVLPYYAYVRSHPYYKADRMHIERINKFYELINSALNEEYKGKRKEDVIKGLVTSMVFQISDDLEELGLMDISVKTKSKEYYFMKFMELLLLNFREHHAVGFYANELALSPKYLSALIKDFSGLSATQWISDYIVVEAKTLLKSSEMNINQIADYLFFPNPSFFSKYFKQHTGLTPKQYRLKGDK